MKSPYKYITVLAITYICIYVWSVSFGQTPRLWDIEMRFCNNDQTANEVDFTTNVGKNLPICIELKNKAKKSATIGIEFVDAVITDDEFKDRACNAPDRAKPQFGNYVQTYDHNIILQWGETVKKEYIVKYPGWFEWLSHGCLLYNVINDQPEENSMINVIVRSAKFIDVFVGKGKVSQVISMTTPTIKKVGDEYILTLWINNKGNVDEKISITSTLSNIIGPKKEFKFDSIVPANTWIIFTTTSMVLPTFGWIFLLKSKVTYTPQFNFNITNGKKPSEMYTWGIKNIQNFLFIWTRRSGIMIFITLLILYIIIKYIQKYILPVQNIARKK